MNQAIRILAQVCFYIVLFLVVIVGSGEINLAYGAPSVDYKGGRYYLYKDGERLDKYYNQDYTAKAAAANLSFECDCPITIKQPDITVTTTQDADDNTNVMFSWSRPLTREDGSELLEDEIDHYLLEVNGIEMEIYSLSLTLQDVDPGTYQARVAVVLKNGERSEFTKYETLDVEDE